MTKPYGAVLLKAAKILDFLAVAENETTLKTIATSVEMTTSTTLKILDTLQMIGYVTRNEATKTYYLGPSLAKFGHHYVERSHLKESALQSLDHLQNEVDETIHLGVRSAYELVYLEKIEPKHRSIFMSSKVGASKPLYSTGMGKVFLADFSNEEREAYFATVPLIAYTEKTITNKFLLEKELVEIKEAKMAFDDEEMEADCFCIAMPIYRNGEIEGAFSVSLPKFRATPERITLISRQMKQTKEEIEQKLAFGQ